MSDPRLQQSKAVLLVGGMGTRLRSVVASKPKPLVSLGERSFLGLLVEQLRRQGLRRLVMCTGYLAEQIESEFGDGAGWGVEIEYSHEQCPRGTAGALKLAAQKLQGIEDFVVMNGDSFVQLDFARMMRFHRERGALVTIAVRKVENSDRYGTVLTAQDGRITGFLEKTGRQVPGLVNAGVYVFRHAILERIPEGPSSLEKDVFPGILDSGIYALEQTGMFIDIGTPEDYARARELSDHLYEAALGVESERGSP